jgi:hypothetical protein
LWATTPQFLTQFGLKDLRELPKREDLVTEQPGALDRTPGAADQTPSHFVTTEQD